MDGCTIVVQDDVTFEFTVGAITVRAVAHPHAFRTGSQFQWAYADETGHLFYNRSGLEYAYRAACGLNEDRSHRYAGYRPTDVPHEYLNLWEGHRQKCRVMVGDPSEPPLVPLAADATGVGTIYLVRGGNLLKIGFTKHSDPERRLTSLQTGSPRKLQMYHWCRGTRADEKALHKRFAKWRLRGEWFEDRREIRDAFAKLEFDQSRSRFRPVDGEVSDGT